MLKNKFKIVALLMVIILALSIPIVRATDEENGENPTVLENTQEEPTPGGDTNTNSNFKKADVYLTGEDVKIDYIVDGNLFVLADNVTISSQIGGDAFICAKTINIEKEGYIFSNLFACTQNLTISGVVYDLYAVSQEINLNGYIYRDIRTSSNNLNINGVIGRNAYVNANNINFANSDDNNSEESLMSINSSISGDFNYSSNQETTIPEGCVNGNINFTKSEQSYALTSEKIQDNLLSLGGAIVTAIAIWFICLWIAPKFLESSNDLLSKKILPILGYGILTPIVAIIGFIILLILGITAKLALLGSGILVILLLISSSIFAIMLNNIACKKLNIEKTIGKLGTLILVTIALWILKLIPYLGGLLSFISIIIGLGFIIKSFVDFIKKDNKNKQTENK